MPEIQSNWESLKDIVADALELSAAERDPFLIDKCGDNLSLLDEARALIGAHDHADGVIDSRTDAWLGLGGPDLLALSGQRIGRYTLQSLVAEGAMAAVYRAQQSNPHRCVALKLVRAAMPLVDAAHRFKREAAALGRLQHPNIARIYEAGVHRGTGGTMLMPFIAMEFVDGMPLNVFARQHNLSREARIRLLIKVASAVHAAHQQAVIHRDLKPANVLVDMTGEPKVLDFGIARIIGAEDEHKNTWQTTAGVLLGTPGYMSPEQAGGNPDSVDVRSDVWSLGVLLHELLTDRLPVDLKSTSIAEVLRRIETVEPEPIGKHDPSLRGDLETVVATALAREKDRRYASAEAMANDLRHVLNYEPISARPPSNWYRLKKFARRHRVGLSFAILLTLLLIGAAIVASIGFVNARRERDRLARVSAFLETLLSAPDPSAASKDTTVLQAIKSAEGRLAVDFADDPLTEARLRQTLGQTFFQLGDYDNANVHITRCVKLRTERLGATAPETIEAVAWLANVLRWQDKPLEARQLAQQAFDRAVKDLGPEHPSILTIMDPLAGTYSDQADYEPAKAMYAELVRLNEKVLGPNDAQTLTSMNNLGNVLLGMGVYDEAERIFTKLVDIRSKFMKPDNASLLINKLNLHVAQNGLGNYVAAEKGFRDVWELSRQSLGPDHGTSLITQSCLADTLGRLGRFDEAIEMASDTLERHKRASGEASSNTLAAALGLGWRLHAAERYVDAENHARHYIEICAATRGPDSPEAWAHRENLAMALDGQGRIDEAIPLYKAALDVQIARRGIESKRTATLQSFYGKALNSAKRFTEAAEVLAQAVGTIEKLHVGLQEAGTRRNYGVALTGTKQFEEAEKQLLRAYEIEKDGSERRSPMNTAWALAALYEAWEKPDESSLWKSRARTTQPSTKPASNPR